MPEIYLPQSYMMLLKSCQVSARRTKLSRQRHGGLSKGKLGQSSNSLQEYVGEIRKLEKDLCVMSMIVKENADYKYKIGTLTASVDNLKEAFKVLATSV